jgi:uncharacterized membrane protein YgdD (TMEM256/DUF423 family)
MHNWLPLGALFVAIAIAAGAFGAHSLRAHLDAPHLALWETAARYFVYGGLGLVAVGIAARLQPVRAWAVPGTLLAAGSVIFSVTVGLLAVGQPRWLGAITPVGGVLLIAGFLALAIIATRR